MAEPLVGIIMGSSSDWETMRHAAETLDKLGVPNETRVVSAHRTPQDTVEFVEKSEKEGCEIVVAAAGGAAGRPSPSCHSRSS